MSNYPSYITLPDNGAILELTDETPINKFVTPSMGGGYIRQLGDMVVEWDIDDFVQFDGALGVQFSQGGINYLFIDKQYIFFKQDPLP